MGNQQRELSLARMLWELFPYALGMGIARAYSIILIYDSYLHSDAGFLTDAVTVGTAICMIIGFLITLKLPTPTEHQFKQMWVLAVSVGVVVGALMTHEYMVGDKSLYFYVLAIISMLAGVWCVFYWIRELRGVTPQGALTFVLLAVIISEVIIYSSSFLDVTARHVLATVLLPVQGVSFLLLKNKSSIEDLVPYEVGTYLSAEKGLITNLTYLVAFSLGTILLAIPVGMARGYPNGSSIPFTPGTHFAYVALAITLSFVLIILINTVKRFNFTVISWLIAQALITLAIVLYVLYPNNLEYGAIFATVANIYMLTIMWYTISMVMTVGKYKPLYYMAVGWIAYMGPRAFGRLGIYGLYDATMSRSIVLIAMTTMILISTQVVFGFLLLSRIKPTAQGSRQGTSAGAAVAADKPAASVAPAETHAGAGTGAGAATATTDVAEYEVPDIIGGTTTATPATIAQGQSACNTPYCPLRADAVPADSVFATPEKRSSIGQPVSKLFGIDNQPESDIEVRIASMERSVAQIGDQFQLTQREMEVLTLFALGYTQKRVAETLNLSPGTVHTHIKNIYEKTDFHSRQDVLNYIHDYTE